MKVKVQVQNDYLERISKVRKPLLALSELIWNGLDADATRVDVDFKHNGLGGLDEITVTDNGDGICYADALLAFKNLGGSNKRGAGRSKSKRRLLHGKAGKGRFRAFALGDFVEWNTEFRDNGSAASFKINGSRMDLGTFDISDPVKVPQKIRGTEVRIHGIQKNYPSLEARDALQELTQYFALYLREYPDVSIFYSGTKIDPSSIEERVTNFELGSITLGNGKEISAQLTVIEWKTLTDRSLFLCDSAGFALAEIPPGIQAPGFNFTAYLKSEHIRDLDNEDALLLEDLHPDVKTCLEYAKGVLRDHFRQRISENAQALVAQWKQEKIYPYEGKPKGILDETERQVFDVVALNINSYLPDFNKADVRSKKLSLRLIKQALERSPGALQTILSDVFNLPADKQEEFATLLKKTTLPAMIKASRTVTDRLDFLKGLELLVFNLDSKETLLERQQLHKILADHTWIFGEEFNLTVNDKSLTDVLEQHLHLLGRGKDDVQPVLRNDNTVGIVDLMLSRRIPQPKAEEREHLVIELKRPKQDVDATVAAQIESYAIAVSTDERFRDTKTRWVFWAVSNDMSDVVRKKVRQRNRAEGMLYDDDEGRITIWVKTWSQIIENCRARLTFFQELLNYSADDESGIEFLRSTHEKYLPKVFKAESK